MCDVCDYTCVRMRVSVCVRALVGVVVVSIVYCELRNWLGNSDFSTSPSSRRRYAGKLCPMYSHSPLDSVTYYVGRVEGEASVPRVARIQYYRQIYP